MDNEKLKKQLRDMCIAADGLATAMHLFYANVSSDILDDFIEEAEKENIRQRNIYATHDRAERLGIAEHILLVMFGQTPDELNGIMEKEARNFNSVINAIQHGNEEASHHCGQDATCPVGGGCATVQDPNESQPADTVPESIKELVGMQIVSVFPPGWKCQGCAYDSDYSRCEKKVELVGGAYICLAPLPNSITTE